MKIYTKTGDKGTTALYGGTRVKKYNLRIDSYGTVDELNSYIGLIKDQEISDTVKEVLLRIQNELFTLGAMLATPPEKETLKSGKERLNIPKVNENSITFLENEIDKHILYFLVVIKLCHSVTLQGVFADVQNVYV